MKTRMIIKDQKTDGAVPVDVSVEADRDRLIIHWKDTDFVLPADEVQAIMMGDDGR